MTICDWVMEEYNSFSCWHILIFQSTESKSYTQELFLGHGPYIQFDPCACVFSLTENLRSPFLRLVGWEPILWENFFWFSSFVGEKKCGRGEKINVKWEEESVGWEEGLVGGRFGGEEKVVGGRFGLPTNMSSHPSFLPHFLPPTPHFSPPTQHFYPSPQFLPPTNEENHRESSHKIGSHQFFSHKWWKEVLEVLCFNRYNWGAGKLRPLSIGWWWYDKVIYRQL